MQAGEPSSSGAGGTLAVPPPTHGVNDSNSRKDLVSGSSGDSAESTMDPEVPRAAEAHACDDPANLEKEIADLLDQGLTSEERLDFRNFRAEMNRWRDGLSVPYTGVFPNMVPKASMSSQSSQSSTSTTWSGSRARVAPRRVRRRIAKMKENARRRGYRVSVEAVRLAKDTQGWRQVSDDSDVGADSDSDEWWTECSSDNSSVKDSAAASYECNGLQPKLQQEAAEAPPMGQFLLPLLGSDPVTDSDVPFHIRHEDILQLLASAEESARAESAADVAQQPEDMPVVESVAASESGVLVTPEEEADVLRFVCEAERDLSEDVCFPAVEDWLLAAYSSWCETSALMYTLLGVSNVGIDYESWISRVRASCRCRLCVCRAHGAQELASLAECVVVALARDERTMRDAALLVRSLRLRRAGAPLQPHVWGQLSGLTLSPQGQEVVGECMRRLHDRCPLAREMSLKGCLCRPREDCLPPLYGVEAFVDMLERFKSTYYATFQVEMLAPDGSRSERLDAAARRLAVHLRDLVASPRQHRDTVPACDCQNPPMLNATERKKKLKMLMQCLKEAVNSDDGGPEAAAATEVTEAAAGEPCVDWMVASESVAEIAASLHAAEEVADPNDFSDPEWESGSTSESPAPRRLPSMDSASRLLLGAAAMVEAAGGADAAPAELCRTVRHLCKSITSIEVLMDRVLKHCSSSCATELDDCSARSKLQEVDRKLMAMYRWLPEMHQKQLQVYRTQKQLSYVCMQLVGGSAPPPPPPGSPPPSAPATPSGSPRSERAEEPRPVCPEYHLRRFREVKRKVLHMREQQLYYHRLRQWVAEQLRRPDGNGESEDVLLRRRLRHILCGTRARRTGAGKRRPIARPHRALHLPRRAAADGKEDAGGATLEHATNSAGDGQSDTDTIVDGTTDDLNKEMKECVARFANIGLNAPDLNVSSVPANTQVNTDNLSVYPDSTSPPLQDLSPTCSEPLPVYRAAKSNHRLLAVNKLLNRSANMLDRLKEDICSDFDKNPPLATPDLLDFIPPTTRRMPLLVEEIKEKVPEQQPVSVESQPEKLAEQINELKISEKEPRVHKYVEFGMEIKKAIEECQNIINSCNSYIKVSGDTTPAENKEDDRDDAPLSFEQIYEAIMSLEKNSTDILECMDRNLETTEPVDEETETKLAAIVESMPQILANMPEIATKLSEFANVSFELPEFASMLNNLPEINSEAQLTPETLRQIRELKVNRARDGLGVTKNTTKRKTGRKLKENDVIGTITFDIDSKDISELIRDEKELQAHLKNKNCSKEDFRDLLLTVSAQVVTSKVYECIKQNSDPNCEEVDENGARKRDILEGFEVKDKFFQNCVKIAYSMQDFREFVRGCFHSWKSYLASTYHISPQFLEERMHTCMQELYMDIEKLAEKQNQDDSQKVPEKLEQEAKVEKDHVKAEPEYSTECSEHVEKEFPCDCLETKPSEIESLKQIMKFIKDSVGSALDIILMQTSKMSKGHKKSVKNLKFKYMDVIRRCAESSELANWILLDPDVASNVILEMTGLPAKSVDDTNIQDVTKYTLDKRLQCFMKLLADMNRAYMQSLPHNNISSQDWLVTLYRLEQLENSLKDALTKAAQPSTQAQTIQTTTQTTQTTAQTRSNTSETREAELVAGKGLSKIINQTSKPKKTPAPNEVTNPKAQNTTPAQPADINSMSWARLKSFFNLPKETFLGYQFYQLCYDVPKTEGNIHLEQKMAILSKCEQILNVKGDTSLLETFVSIKTHISINRPVPESLVEQVLKICASIDVKLLGDVGIKKSQIINEEKTTNDSVKAQGRPKEEKNEDTPKMMENQNDSSSGSNNSQNYEPKQKFSGINSHNPELLAKYSAQALRNVKQSLNAVAFNSIRSSSAEAHKSDCKWTSECTCVTCQGNTLKEDGKSDAAKPVVKPAAKVTGTSQAKTQPPRPVAKPVPKACENVHQGHQQHVCKMGHTTTAAGCANEGHQNAAATDGPCTCCYCTVFGHAPPMTTPVPRNFNETRERLRSILNRKKQKGVIVPAKPPPLPATSVQACNISQIEAQRTQLGQVAVPPTSLSKLPPGTNSPVGLTKPPPGLAKPPPGYTKPIQELARPPPPKLKPTQNALAEKISRTIANVAEKKDNLPQTRPAEKPPTATVAPQPQRPLSPRSPPYPPRLLPVDQEALEKRMLQEVSDKGSQTQPKLNGQRQPPPQQQQAGPHNQRNCYSSRDTSVFSTSSGCSAVSGWRDGCVSDDGFSRIEDTRDLDALLQYIEGPTRHVDRGKKKAKKQRQKAKKMEGRLLEEYRTLTSELRARQHAKREIYTAFADAKKALDETKTALDQVKTKKKGKKKNKLNPMQQAQQMALAEQHGRNLGVYLSLQHAVKTSDHELAEVEAQLTDCVSSLRAARAVHSVAPEPKSKPQPTPVPQERPYVQPPPPAKPCTLPPMPAHMQAQPLEGGMVRIRRSPGDGAVTVTPLQVWAQNHNVPVYSAPPRPQQPPQPDLSKDDSKKQTWETALADIKALATQPAKTKEKEKKQKSSAPQPVGNPKKNNEKGAVAVPVLAAPEEPLSKKQKKRLARQQAEEEEVRMKLEEAKAKKADKKAEKLARDAEAKKTEAAKAVKKGKKGNVEVPKQETKKSDKQEKKGKENKANNLTVPSGKQQQKQQAPSALPAPATEKKNKKQQQPKPVYNGTTENANHLHKHICSEDSPSCSIMDQLNSGIQVADLKLPPGITLTRVPASMTPTTPAIKSIPLWKSGTLAAAPTPPARAQPVINADPSMHTHSLMEPSFGVAKPTVLVEPQPAQPVQTQPGKSKKAKKRAKKAAAAAAEAGQTSQLPQKDGTKMVTLRNPMFHPNLPPVQVSSHVKKAPEQVRQQDPISVPPNACQATITPTSNGMYTIRNPLMSMVHQQSLMGMTPPPTHNYQYEAPGPHKHFVEERNHYQGPNPGLNLASFTQKNDEGYSLFKPAQEDDRSGAGPHFNEYGYETHVRPNPIVSPNPIGTRPEPRYGVEVDPFRRVEPIGTPLRRDDEPAALYTPFGGGDEIRAALFHNDMHKEDNRMNADTLPYLQRLRAGGRLNSEVSIHHANESKFFKPTQQEPPQTVPDDISPFRTAYSAKSWTPGFVSASASPASVSHSSFYDSLSNSSNSPHTTDQHGRMDASEEAFQAAVDREDGFGAIGRAIGSHRLPNGVRHNNFYPETSVFAPDRSVELSSLDSSERDIESFKRFDYYFEPPKHKPKIALNLDDIAAHLKPKDK